MKVFANSTGKPKNLPVISLIQNAKFADPNILSINEDNNGMMWVGSASGRLGSFENRQESFFMSVLIWDSGNSRLKGRTFITIK